MSVVDAHHASAAIKMCKNSFQLLNLNTVNKKASSALTAYE
jgi:hypothetical protein